MLISSSLLTCFQCEQEIFLTFPAQFDLSISLVITGYNCGFLLWLIALVRCQVANRPSLNPSGCSGPF